MMLRCHKLNAAVYLVQYSSKTDCCNRVLQLRTAASSSPVKNTHTFLTILYSSIYVKNHLMAIILYTDN